MSKHHAAGSKTHKNAEVSGFDVPSHVGESSILSPRRVPPCQRSSDPAITPHESFARRQGTGEAEREALPDARDHAGEDPPDF
jgi:hypothetical protein